MKIHSFAQYSPEWTTARLGKITASEADALVSPEGKVRTGEGVTTYLYKKITEKILGFASDAGSSWQMEHGSIMEHEALPWLEFAHDIKVDRVGLVESDDGRCAASPDGLIGEVAGVEIKCAQPAQALKYLIEGVVPKEYRVQVQFSLFVTGRPWWFFLSYSRQWPALLIRVERDEEMQSAIRTAVDQFSTRFDQAFAKIKAMKDAENAIRSKAADAN